MIYLILGSNQRHTANNVKNDTVLKARDPQKPYPIRRYLPIVWDYPPPPAEDFTCHVASKHRLDDECQVIHEFSVAKCCLSYLNIFEFKRDSYLFGDMSQEVSRLHVFHKSVLVSHVINQSRKIYSGRHACLTKENVTEMLRASRRHHLCL